MSERERRRSEASNNPSRWQFPQGQRIVVTTPAWARNLPPDELSDDEEPGVHGDLVPTRVGEATPNRRTSANSARHRSNASTSQGAGGQGVQMNGHANGYASGAAGANGVSTATASSNPTSTAHNHTTPLLPAFPAEAHAENQLQRNGSAQLPPPVTAADRGWWTFTLPGKYLDRVHGYIHPSAPAEYSEKGKGRPRTGEHADTEAGEEDEDARSMRSTRSVRSWISRTSRRSRSKDVEKRDYHRKMSQHLNMRLPAAPKVFSVNQTTTPGWSTPWTPFRRERTQNDLLDPFELTQQQTERQSKRSRLEKFILENPFSPLFIRTINLCLIATTLGLAAHIRIQETDHDAIGIMGSSTLFAIVVAPFAIVHIFVTLYIEYFGRPIGLWRISKKMFYTLTELIFICLYSAILSLAFGDLFTSSLECTSWTPYRRYNLPPPTTVGNAAVDGTVADSICQQQIAQVVIVFLSVIFYIIVLVISLWRIFAKVSRNT
ncbi:hypothetical protein JCM10908_001054 [Rhodotorula pacifica]|uniref:phospholipase D regulator n=1 Tax=Rhodotorula pacifica TaxID=1495444 RepID=UPI00317F5EB9